MFVKFISGFSPRFDVMVDHRPFIFTIAQEMEQMNSLSLTHFKTSLLNVHTSDVRSQPDVR